MGSSERRRFLSLCAAAVVPPMGLVTARLRQSPGAASFPALRQQIAGRPLTYLDSAATTLRPQAVIDALDGFLLDRQCQPVAGRTRWPAARRPH